MAGVEVGELMVALRLLFDRNTARDTLHTRGLNVEVNLTLYDSATMYRRHTLRLSSRR